MIGFIGNGQCGTNTEVNEKDQLFINSPQPLNFTSLPSLIITIVAVSAGSRHSLALSDHGAVFSWGWGSLGQLGHGIRKSSSHPMKIKDLDQVSHISAGGMHSGCVLSNGACYTWGSGTYGQLGLGKVITLSATPAMVQFARSESNSSNGKFLFAKTISCGGMHTAVVDLEGHVYCWGRSDSGQTSSTDWYLGHSPGIFYPNFVSGFEGAAVDVSCGGFHTLVLTEKGIVYAIGKEDFGVLGIGNDNENSMTIGVEKPILISSLKNSFVTSISAGGWHSCFTTNQGHLFSCGKGEYGRLGVGDEKSRTEPSKVLFSDEVVSSYVTCVSAGGSHTIWSTNNGKVFTVGRVDGGRLGIGATTIDRFMKPIDITKHFINPQLGKISKVLQVSAGGSHSLVLVEYL